MFKIIINTICKHQLRYGAMLSYVQIALHILINLLYTPYLIRMLGRNEYGLYSTVASSIHMLSLLSLGLNAGYIRYFSKYKTTNDYESINKLNGLYFILFSLIGLIAFLFGIYLSNNLYIIFNNGLTESEYKIASLLALLSTINISISFPASVFSTIISANEKFIVLKLLLMVKNVVVPLLMLPILHLGYKSIALVLVTVFVSLVVDLIYYVYCRKQLNTKFKFTGIDFNLIKDLFIYTFFIAINLIVDQINWNIDKVLLGRYCGTSAVAIYAVGYNLFAFYQSMSIAVSGVFTPRIHSILNRIKQSDLQNNLDDVNLLFIKVGRIQFLILSLISSGIVLFGKQFINIWVGSGYEDSYYIAILLILPASIALVQNIGIEIQRALNKHQFRSLAYLVMAFVNLVISVFLCQSYGAVGCAIGTAISLILANGIIMNVYYYLKCGINVYVFWKNILKMSFGFIVPLLGFYAFENYFCQYTSIKNFVFGVVLYSILFAFSMWFISMNEYEKSLIPVLGKYSKFRKENNAFEKE